MLYNLFENRDFVSVFAVALLAEGVDRNYLRKAIMATVGPELHEVTSEQVGILKLMKLAVETDRFMQQLKTEGREQYSIGEYVEKVYNPVMNL